MPTAHHLYFGTNTGNPADGIYRATFDATTGALSTPTLAVATLNPNFLASHPSGRTLYAVGDVRDAAGRATGVVRAFAVAPVTGALTLLNEVPSDGLVPCHARVDATGQCLLVANYTSGSVAAFPLRADGQVAPAVSLIQHAGRGPHPQRQTGPHVHSVTLTPDNGYAVVADLGIDQLVLYRLDPATATLSPHTPAQVPLAPGAGPRHTAFHPTLPVLYVINELGNTLTAFAYTAASATFTHLQTLSTLPAGFSGESFTAEIVVHPSGRWLYGSNRGHDSLTVCAIALDGTLTVIQHQPTLGHWPRHFALDPSGHWLLAANQRASTLTTFRFAPTTGLLTPVGAPVAVPNPTCVHWHASTTP